MQFSLCRTKFYETPAFPACAFAKGFAFSAYIKTAAVFLFVRSVFGWDKGNKLGYLPVYALRVNFLKKAFFAERTAHSRITDTTEHGGTAAVIVLPLSETGYSFGATLSGRSKSLRS